MTPVSFSKKSKLSKSGPTLLTILLFLFFTFQGFAEPRFGGGMTGYFQYADIQKTDGTLSGPAFGLGGILNYTVSAHFRVSCMGSTYRLGYENPGMKGSRIDMGYGGIGLEYCFPVQSDYVAFGIMVGGGKISNLFIWSKMKNDSISARFESEGIILGSPIITYEHALTKTVFALIRLDYLAGFHEGAVFTLGSPGLRIGVIFKK